MRDLSMVVKAQATSLQRLSSKLDFSFLRNALLSRFSQRPLNNGGGGQGGTQGPFDWAALGSELSPLSLSPPLSCCLLGTLQQEAKVRKTSVRRKLEGEQDTEVVKPVSLVAQESELDEATNERVATLLRVTAALSEEDGRGYFDVLQLLVDPVSPLQSVENLFDFAFLLKEKRVVVAQDRGAEEGGVHGVAVDPTQLEGREKQQRVLAVPMKDLRLLAQLLHGVRVTHPLHREDALYEETDPLKQSRLLGSKRKGGEAE
ncbi:hypothetical protein EON64_08150, partial [archaeon]